MSSVTHKKYTLQAKRGIKGEAFFELLLSDYAIPHRIVGSKDIGVDYICEWAYGDKPTGILFTVQVKTSTEKSANPKFVAVEKNHNGLDKYEIRNSKLRIDNKTLHYWEGFAIPAYLFVIVQKTSGTELDCYYRRYTSVLTGKLPDQSGQYYEGFYKANNGASLIAFKDSNNRLQGFARDLFIDHVRWSYAKGLFAYFDPKSMGLNQFQSSDESVFADLFEEYKVEILSTHAKNEKILNALKK